jgi:hypothetical protein
MKSFPFLVLEIYVISSLFYIAARLGPSFQGNRVSGWFKTKMARKVDLLEAK